MLPNYLTNPYPCEFIVLTTGGARYVSLGELPDPKIDPRTGYVTNAETIYIPNCDYEEIVPWAVMVLVFNPEWLVDPGPESVEQRERMVARVLVEVLQGGANETVTPVFVGDTQIGTVARGIVPSTGVFGTTVNAIASPAQSLTTALVQRAALSQPPNLVKPEKGTAG
jgi:hypothetical protein